MQSAWQAFQWLYSSPSGSKPKWKPKCGYKSGWELWWYFVISAFHPGLCSLGFIALLVSPYTHFHTGPSWATNGLQKIFAMNWNMSPNCWRPGLGPKLAKLLWKLWSKGCMEWPLGHPVLCLTCMRKSLKPICLRVWRMMWWMRWMPSVLLAKVACNFPKGPKVCTTCHLTWPAMIGWLWSKAAMWMGRGSFVKDSKALGWGQWKRTPKGVPWESCCMC